MPALWLCLQSIFAGHALASPSDAETAAICEEASVYAAARVGVPVQILRALTRTETGRRLEGQFLPWPWTVNMEGEGKWFASPAEALNYALSNHDTGARSFDIGCFQVNFKWHGEAFASIEDMFDPYQNALYAARFIAGLYTELGSWPAAAGAYHSRTPDNADKYSARFSDILARLDGSAETFVALPDSDGSEFVIDDSPPVIRIFAPLVPVPNLTGSLFIANMAPGTEILVSARGSLLQPN